MTKPEPRVTRTRLLGMDLVLDLPEGDLEVRVTRPPDIPDEPGLPLQDTPGKADLRGMLDQPDPGTRGIEHELAQKRGLDTREQAHK